MATNYIDFLNRNRSEEEKLRSGIRPEVADFLMSKYDPSFEPAPLTPGASSFDVGVSKSTASAPVQLGPPTAQFKPQFQLESPYNFGTPEDEQYRKQMGLTFAPGKPEIAPKPAPVAPKPAPIKPKPIAQPTPMGIEPQEEEDPTQEGMSAQQKMLDNIATQLNEDIARADKSKIPQLIAQAFAGLGDAMILSAGGSSNFLGQAQKPFEERRAGLERRKELLAGRQDVETAAADARKAASASEKQRRAEADRDYQLKLKEFGLKQSEAATKAKQDLRASKGFQERDKEFAKVMVEYEKGGFADEMKQIDQLRRVKTALESGGQFSGPLIGRMSRENRALINPKSVNIQEQVEEVVQRNLRQILGAQFAEKEGERLISRAYNPLMSEEINADRVNRLLGQMEAAAKAKAEMAEYFRTNGTLEGYQGQDMESAFWAADPDSQNVPRGTSQGGVPQAPEVGAVMGDPGDEYEFTGGDPSDQDNWRKV